MTIAFISHPDCLLHDMGPFHPEQPARVTAIENAIKASSLKNLIKEYLAPLVTREQLLRAHSSNYVDSIYKSSPKEGLIALDPDTWMNPFSLTAALRAAGL